MNARIRFLREETGLNQVEFGARVGVKQTTISGWESGRIVPNESAVLNICRTFGVRREWLLTGEEPMRSEMPDDTELADFFADVLADDPESVRRRFVSAMSRLSESDWAEIARLAQVLAAKPKEKE